MFFLKGGNMKRKSNGEHFDFYQHSYGWHQNKQHEPEVKKPSSLTLDVKDRVISLLFGYVDDKTRKELHDYMDDCFEKCHSLALYVTDKDRDREPNEKSKFAILCDSLGLDPGNKQVQVTSNLQVLYSDDYAVPAQPR